MQNFEVQLPDGTIIEGPTKEAALIAAKRRLGVENTPKEEGGSISAAPNDFLASAIGKLRSLLPASSTNLINALPQEATKQEIIGKSAPLIEAGVGAGTAVGATALTGNPAIGQAAASLSMPITDRILKYSLGQSPNVDASLLPNMGGAGSVIEDAAKNEILGRVIGQGAEAMKLSPTNLAKSTGISREATRLGGTTGQLSENPIISTFEDLFARKSKLASIAKSGANAVERVGQLTSTSTPLNAPEGVIDNLLSPDNAGKLSKFLQTGSYTVNEDALNASKTLLEAKNVKIRADNTSNLENYLKTGKWKAPIPEKVLPDIPKNQPLTITSENPRKDLQGYIMNKIFENNKISLDPTDLTKVSLDGQGMLEDFANIVKSQKGSNTVLFNNKQTADFSEFLKAVKTTTEIGRGPGPWMAIDLGAKALGIGGALLAGRTIGVPAGATVLGGYVGADILARVLTSRTAAPILLNIVKGQPLGMSINAASRILANSMARQPITLDTSQGKMLGAFDNNGNIQVQ